MVVVMSSSPKLLLGKFLDFFQHTRPAAGVILPGSRLSGETTVRYLHVRARFGGSQFPANDRAMFRIIVKISEPRVDQKPRRINLEHFPIMPDYIEPAIWFRHAHLQPPFAAHSKIHLEDIEIWSTPTYGLG